MFEEQSDMKFVVLWPAMQKVQYDTHDGLKSEDVLIGDQSQYFDTIEDAIVFISLLQDKGVKGKHIRLKECY